ncbi:hypothetical protein [Vibrio algicola]|uniref:DUF1330 domain-containing protein n=1 Tax=Vibrio algicola TaxID=2662262 RepID=A0A5Q0TE62_9VIBR|nr:hypothetical protein [Vibrio algicola]
MYLFCRQSVQDYQVWQDFFRVSTVVYEEAGLILKNVWKGESNNVFIIFKVENVKVAKAFIKSPATEKHREKAGVLTNEMHFMEEI